MPCRDEGRYDNDTKDRLDKVTRMLCRLCSLVPPCLLDVETGIWWEAHQRTDTERAAREAAQERLRLLREEADSDIRRRLTEHERKILGM